MTDLRDALGEYLVVRRSLGYKLERAEKLLGQFVAYAEDAGTTTVTIESCVNWATLPPSDDGWWWAYRLCIVRGFARYLRTVDPATEVPPADLLPVRARRAVPYPYSEGDIVALMDATAVLRTPLRRLTYSTIVGLLVVSGMRIGEILGSDRGDVHWERSLLTVHHAKFDKARQVPLHETTLAALSNYDRRRDELLPCPSSEAFFLSNNGTRIDYRGFHHIWKRLVLHAGVEPRSPVCRPRPHDVRHHFATTCLLRWYREGADVHALLPVLSTWMGHVDPASTFVYLSATPELLELVAQRLEDAWERGQR